MSLKSTNISFSYNNIIIIIVLSSIIVHVKIIMILFHFLLYISCYCRPYYGGYRRRGFSWLALFLVFIIVVTIVSISLGIHYSIKDSIIDPTKEYALTDKVIRSYESDFCKGLLARSTNLADSPQSNATLYLLNSRPSLTDSESFNISTTASFSYVTNYHVWNFNLNAGSKFSFSACYTSNIWYDLDFFLIKGNKNHNKWTNDPDRSYAVLYKRLSSQCQTVNYQVNNDDLYFLVFYLDPELSFSRTLSLNFSFDRTVYHISQESVVQNCSFPLDGFSRCSLGIPMSSSYTLVLSLNTSLPVDYNDGANVEIDCQPRGWLYAVIVIFAGVVPLIVIVTLVVVCVCYKVRKGKKKYSSLENNTTATSTDLQVSRGVTTTKPVLANSNTNPPPYNPACYSPASPAGGYGATTGTVAPPLPYSK